MPEYLSPGVYIEEVELGPQPIAAVSTSTAGVVGVTERGPRDVPVLLTSFADFTRIFGHFLDPADFAPYHHLPHAVQGFFDNSGQLMYAVRVASEQATRATLELMDSGSPTGFSATLLGRLQGGDALLVLDDATGLVASWLRLLDGPATEYVQVSGSSAPLANRAIGLATPTLVGSEALPATVGVPTIADAAGTATYSGKLSVAAAPGSLQIVLDARPPTGDVDFAPGDLLQVGDSSDPTPEIVEVASVSPDLTDTTVRLQRPLARAHPAGAADGQVKRVTASGTTTEPLSRQVAGGDALLVLDDLTNVGPGDVVAISSGSDTSYNFAVKPTAVALRGAVSTGHPAGEAALALSPASGGPSTTLSSAAAAGDSTLTLASVTGIVAGTWLELSGPGAGDPAEFVLVQAPPPTPPDTVSLETPVRQTHPANAQAVAQTATTTSLLEAVPPGDSEAILADSATTPLAANQTLVLGGGLTAADVELVQIGAILANAAVVALAAPGGTQSVTEYGHLAGLPIAARAPLFEVQALDDGGWGNELSVAAEDEASASVDTRVSATTPAGNDVPVDSLTGVEPGTLVELLDFAETLASFARTGVSTFQLSTVAGVNGGDVLRLGRSDPEYVTVLATATTPTPTVTVTKPLGRDHYQAEPVDRMGPGGLPRLAKIAQRVGGGSVRFDGGGLTFAVDAGWRVRSREFKLTVQWIKRGAANPRTPGLDRVVESEVQRRLTLDARHSRYLGKIVGATTNPVRLWDRRPDGGSDLIRVIDPLASDGTTPDQTQASLRTGPDLIYTLTAGRRVVVGRWLEGGGSDVSGIGDPDYIGQDNVDPLARTGLQSLKNVEDISLVAIPGQVSPDVQTEIIVHCETDGFRFAVLDSLQGDDDAGGASLPDVEAQRQQFDTKYAALYYPWVRIEDPFPADPTNPGEVSMPPSGHILGVYARTDVTRGVHKAPANEVIAGILDLQRILTKGEQDVLNPYPVNINVLRDFRTNFRGLRSYGARVITSDQEWKYVNVRRLFIFIERSLDLGLQWVVFEPNDENLWARVARSVSDFLTTVWQSGALMGTTADQAFFVTCDRTTMTQDDIDNGRLILVVGVAPTMPAEYVVIQIGQWQGGSSVVET